MVSGSLFAMLELTQDHTAQEKRTWCPEMWCISKKIAPVWLKRNVPGESLPEQKLFDQRTLVGILAADETRLLHENPPRFPFLLSLENLKCKTFSEVSKHISFWECHLWDFYYLKVIHFSLLHCHLKAQLAISSQAKWDRRSVMSFSR